MNVRNCRKCGKLFNYVTGAPVCPSCREKLESKFQEVKAYLWEHKMAGIQEVSEECDVEAQQIRQWIREERLELAEGSSILMTCETCGTLITCGRFCEKCKRSMADGFKRTADSMRPEQPVKPAKTAEDAVRNRMRFL